MIAIVKIAPFEHWCDNAKSFAEEHNGGFKKLVGHSIQIITESVKPADHCEGRQWRVPDECGKAQFELAGVPYSPTGEFWICESMLEMD